jgi:hypothetical protein
LKYGEASLRCFDETKNWASVPEEIIFLFLMQYPGMNRITSPSGSICCASPGSRVVVAGPCSHSVSEVAFCRFEIGDETQRRFLEFLESIMEAERDKAD